MPFDMKPVKSSQIKSIGYDATAKKLAVHFINGDNTYHYEKVDQKTFDALSSAESVGSHFHSHIRGKFKHQLQAKPKAKR